jgi:hypothetical protein
MKYFKMLLVLCFLFFISTEPVFAGIGDKIADWVYNGIIGSIGKMINDMIQEVFKSLQDTVYQPTDLSKIFQLQQYVKYAQYAALGWLTFVLVVKAGQGAYLDQIFGQISMGELLQRAIAGYGMIYLLPWAIENIWIYSSNLLVKAIFSLPINNDPQATFKCFLVVGPGTMGLVLGVAILIFAIVLLITSVIRYAEIMGFYMFSPIIATSIAYKGDLLVLFAKELTAVVFSQVWQVSCVYLVMGLLTCSQGLMSYLIAFGVLWVAAKGPSFLKGWAYYSSGMTKSMGSAVTQSVRMAAYSAIRKI